LIRSNTTATAYYTNSSVFVHYSPSHKDESFQ
jgi:hypothetical protein